MEPKHHCVERSDDAAGGDDLTERAMKMAKKSEKQNDNGLTAEEQHLWDHVVQTCIGIGKDGYDAVTSANHVIAARRKAGCAE